MLVPVLPAASVADPSSPYVAFAALLDEVTDQVTELLVTHQRGDAPVVTSTAPPY